MLFDAFNEHLTLEIEATTADAGCCDE